MKTDVRVSVTDMQVWKAALTDDVRSRTVYRDSEEHSFSYVCRTLPTEKDAIDMVLRSRKGRYMGRKRYQWFPCSQAGIEMLQQQAREAKARQDAWMALYAPTETPKKEEVR